MAILVLTILGCVHTRAFAYTPAPMNTEMKSVPALVPFRVWVLPSTSEGSMRSGYWKYVQLEMSAPEAEVLKTPGLVPHVLPVPLPSGSAAVPTM